MNRGIRAGLVLGVVLAATPSSRAVASDAEAVWDDGLRLRADEGRTELRIGMRVQNDWVFQDADDELRADFGEFEDGTVFRRLYLEVDAVIEEAAELRAHLDFAGGEPGLTDAWIALRGLPVLGKVRVGHQYEPIGLDQLTSDRFLMFAERALPTALVPGRNTGVLATNAAGPVTWAAMVARDADDFGNGAGGGYQVTGRLAVVPWREDGGRRLLHVAVAGSRRNPADDEIAFATRPENHLAPRLVDTGPIAADGAGLVGVEGAVVRGSLGAQAEWVGAWIDALDHSDPRLSGWTVASSFFLTGEHRVWSRSSATFGRVKPKRSFTPDGGAGAWELAARFSRLDLDDPGRGVAGGSLDDVTVGLNWYVNPHVRTMTDWVHADVEGSGASDALIVRFEGNF